VVGASEGVSAAAAGGGGGGASAAAASVLRAAVSPVQEEDAAGTPRPGAGPAPRGAFFIQIANRQLHSPKTFFFFKQPGEFKPIRLNVGHILDIFCQS